MIISNSINYIPHIYINISHIWRYPPLYDAQTLLVFPSQLSDAESICIAFGDPAFGRASSYLRLENTTG